MFKTIQHISDIRDAVADKKEIKFSRQPNGVTIGCYQFMDSHTFDTPEAIECRGIAFDESGYIVSRPLHKFFNIGEKAHLSEALLRQRTDIVGIFEKIDGSMIATAWVNDQLLWRSKKSFTSDVVHLATALLAQPSHHHILEFASEVARSGHTAIFELTHPQARIVVDPGEPQLRLLHVRHNISGTYVLLDPSHAIHDLIAQYAVPVVARLSFDLAALLDDLPNWKDREGGIAQFANGDMSKVKCPWYTRMHNSVTFLRERDIARAALHEELDDIKNALQEIGIDVQAVEEVERRLKEELLALSDEIEDVYTSGKDLDRKSFAIAHKSHPLFGLIMSRYIGQEVDLADWYEKNRLKSSFGLRVLADETRAEAFDMPTERPESVQSPPGLRR